MKVGQPPSPEKVAELTEQAYALGKLKEQPGWEILTEIANRKIAKAEERLLDNIRRGIQPSEHECSYLNGCIETVKAILAHPEKAETSLADALARAERLPAITEEVTS